MVWTAEVTTVNQRIQIGAESTSALGTAVAASKALECWDWVPQINGDVQFYTPTGHKYPSLQEENTEWVDVTVTGDLDYNGLIYVLGGAMGAQSAVAHLASATAKDWIFQPPIVGSIVPQTLTVQQGDAIRARSWAYGLFTEWGYKVTRKTLTMSAKMLAAPISDGITLTASPTVIPVLPVVSKQYNVYLDTTSAGLGTTQLLRPLSLDFLMTNIYGPLFVLNRTNIGWIAHVDLMPKSTLKLKMEANAEGMAMLGYLQSGTTYYIRVDALGTVAIATDGPGNIFNEFKHDMAVKFGKPTAFADDQGVYSIEWEAQVVEDSTWGAAPGTAQKVTVTNLLTAL